MQDKISREQVYVIEDLERALLGRQPAGTSEADKQTRKFKQ